MECADPHFKYENNLLVTTADAELYGSPPLHIGTFKSKANSLACTHHSQKKLQREERDATESLHFPGAE